MTRLTTAGIRSGIVALVTFVTGLIVTAGPSQFLIQPQSRTRFFATAAGK